MVSKQQKAKKEWKSLSLEVSLEDTTATFENHMLTVKGQKGEVSRKFKFPKVHLKIEDSKVVISTDRLSQTEKKIIFTYRAHIQNMVKGVTEGFVYNLVVVYAKFPMTVELKGTTFTVKNLLGEKVPRTLEISSDVKVEVKGKDVTVSGIDKEKVGQTAASIEQLCRITHLDRRVVQDGIYITKKPHKAYI